MNRSAFFYPITIAALSILLWMLINQPKPLPQWPTIIQGYSFTPLQANQNPQIGDFPSTEEIESDIRQLSGVAHAIRTYSTAGSFAQIPKIAAKYNLNVALGAWINNDEGQNELQIEQLLNIYLENTTNVVRVIIGNEALLRKEISVSQLIEHLDYTREHLDIPVSTAEPWHTWLKYPHLADHVDYIAVHILPYWENQNVNMAVDFVKQRMQKLKATFPNKPIVIAETGWPSRGTTRGAAKASLANQALYLRNFLEMAEKENYTYYIMEAFDQPWKTQIEGAAGDAWGVFDANRQLKFPLTAPVEPIPQWRTLAAIVILVSIIIITFLFRDSQGLGHKGRGFLTILAFIIVTLLVWIFYHFTQQYLTLSTLITGIILSFSALGIAAVVLAEAHEWAEAAWSKTLRRTPERLKRSNYKPRVSIHVPAYNEPPEMMIKTLNKLAELDYPDFEVLVIDNNTKDPDIWQPVQAHCQKLGEQFRFFHKDPLAGFKGGALNFALSVTDPSAEIIAVIDSDYLVVPEWLAEMIPAFEDQKTAIVQGPQDYHDGGDNLFKAMINAEYQGFFHIGMITRNERNAIIQHGTMTMVRTSVLKEVDGWAEWCITEDSELGLRIFAKGYDAVYIPRSYGRGVMPDTFIDYKKQRFRWAYGAMLILREHMSSLLGFKDNKLTRAQRYHFLAGWLPWIADGVNLLFNLAALLWTTLIIIFPLKYTVPEALFSLLPLTFFIFKVSKMFHLYLTSVGTNYRQSFASAIAGLSLSHTIGRAVMTGFTNSNIGFFRTPKHADQHQLLNALNDIREELLFFISLMIGLAALNFSVEPILLLGNASALDVLMWKLVIAVQSTPFLAAIILSFISVSDKLSSSIIGTMRPVNR